MAARTAPTIDIITMGCSKNMVDSERLVRIFGNAGYKVRHNPDDICADEVIINTCGFIGDAKEESIDMILRCCEAKKSGLVGKVSVMGCLSQRYASELPAEIPEVDRWYGKFDWKKVAADLDVTNPDSSPRNDTKPLHHAYIKISEGCNRFCAFCAIPLITGRHKSRSIEDIIAEVTALAANGVSEFNVIAQDLSSYGTDLYGKSRLAALIEAMAVIAGVKRIRLHYAYPTAFPYDVLPVMRKYPNVCKYLDIALQHISDKVLDNMKRRITGAETVELLDRIRREVPGIHIRTTMMVGFPGEGEKEFAELLDFVRAQRFERLGAFAYCEEDDTYAAKNYDDEVSPEVKQSRLDKLMALQEQIALELNTAKIGSELEVVVDAIGDRFITARSEFDSPEVDPEVLIEKSEETASLRPGEYCKVRITDAMPFELIAEMTAKSR